MKKTAVFTAALAASLLVCAGGTSPGSNGVFCVRDFGAKGDGTAKDTAAIQAAVDAANAAGGGEVLLPAGRYVSGSIFLKSNVDFHVGAGAVLVGSPDKEDYNAADVCPQNGTSQAESSFGAHLLLCIEQENVTVRGPGTIDGNSAVFLINPGTGRTWGYVSTSQSAGQRTVPWRPSQMLYFVESRNIRIQDVELADAPYWTCFLHGCEQVAVRGLYIHNERDRFHTYNGDGLDIDCCRYVTVSDCRIYSADDCITLRASGKRLKKQRDCAFVTVSNCILSTPCNCVRVGVGEGRVHDAVFSNISIRDARTAINFVSAWDPKSTKGVDFRNIRFENWTVDCRQLIRLYAGDVAPGVVREADIRDITFSGFTGRAPDGGILTGLAGQPARNILFRDVDVPCILRTRDVEDFKIEGGRVRQVRLDKALSVRDFGAKGDGVAKDTAAIQKAIDAAGAAGGGVVRLDAGTYLSGTVFMKSGVALHLAAGATLKGSPDREDYCTADAYPQNYASTTDNTSGGHLLVAVGCRDVEVCGPGAIDGNSSAFLVDPATGKGYPDKRKVPWRPAQMLHFVDCHGVILDRVRLNNSPYWSCFMLNSTEVSVKGCTIRTERNKYRTWNGDGLDIDRCRDVFVTGCIIDTDDDSVTLRASCGKRLAAPQDCSNVLVRRCRLSSSCNAVRVGVGEGVIRDCRLAILEIVNTRTAVNIVSAYSKNSRGTDIRNIVFDDVEADCTRFADVFYRYATETEMRDITFKGVRAKVKEDEIVRREPDRKIENLIFENTSFVKREEAKESK